jgi:hypothetical protein
MRKGFKNSAIALGFSGAMAFVAATSPLAAPVPSATLAVKVAAPDHLANVYWRSRWGWGGGGLVAAGLTAGFIGAAATAAYGGYYPSPAYAYPAPVYGVPAYTYAAYPVAPYYYARRYSAPYYWSGYARPNWRAGYYARPYWGYRRDAYWRRW